MSFTLWVMKVWQVVESISLFNDINYLSMSEHVPKCLTTPHIYYILNISAGFCSLPLLSHARITMWAHIMALVWTLENNFSTQSSKNVKSAKSLWSQSLKNTLTLSKHLTVPYWYPDLGAGFIIIHMSSLWKSHMFSRVSESWMCLM